MTDQYQPLGDYSKPKTKGYFFVINDWIDPVKILYKDIELDIDPTKYFITSGEAITKCSVLEQDLWHAYKSILKSAFELLEDNFDDALEAMRSNKLNKINSKLQQCLINCWRSACQSRYLVIHLIEARGAHLFLETDWSEGKVLCYPKNPRGVKF